MTNSITNSYEHKALLYAENYGIINYTVKNNKMRYYESYYLERATYKRIVNLDTMEVSSQELKYYYPNKNR